MANPTSNIFESESDESPTTTIRKTMKVSLDDGGIPVVSFATKRGKFRRSDHAGQSVR